MVSRDAVSKEVSKESKVSDRAVIEANAVMQSDVILAQRTDIQRARKITMSLLAELEQTTDNRELFEQLGQMLSAKKAGYIEKTAEQQASRLLSYVKVAAKSKRGNIKDCVRCSLKEKIKAKADALVSAAAVSIKVSTETTPKQLPQWRCGYVPSFLRRKPIRPSPASSVA